MSSSLGAQVMTAPLVSSAPIPMLASRQSPEVVSKDFLSSTPVMRLSGMPCLAAGLGCPGRLDKVMGPGVVWVVGVVVMRPLLIDDVLARHADEVGEEGWSPMIDTHSSMSSMPKEAVKARKPGNGEREAVAQLVKVARARGEDLPGPEGLRKTITAAVLERRWSGTPFAGRR